MGFVPRLPVQVSGEVLPMFRWLTSSAALSLTASAAFAHEGHGHPDHTDGVLHYVVNPSHAVTGVTGVVVAVALLFAMRMLVHNRSDNR